MRAKYLIALVLFYGTGIVMAQTSKPRITLNAGLTSHYKGTFQDRAVKGHLSIGGDMRVIFNKKWVVAYAQSISILPADLFREGNIGYRKAKLSKYIFYGGYKWDLSFKMYLMGSAKVGGGIFKLQDDDPEREEFVLSDSKASPLLAPEIKAGYRLNKVLNSHYS